MTDVLPQSAAIPCHCRSFNRPEWGGTTLEIIVQVPPHLRDDGRDTVCLDLCIAPYVLLLWAAGIKTYGSCCGHNGKAQRNVVISAADVPRAQRLSFAGADLLYWKDDLLVSAGFKDTCEVKP